MKNALLFALLVLTGCKENALDDPASQLAGSYHVTTYVVDADTLISTNIGNRSPYSDLSIKVNRTSDNTVQVLFVDGPDGSKGGSGVPSIRVETDNSRYRLVAPDNTIDTYFGYADRKTFYTDGAGWDPERNKVIRTVIIGER